MVNRSPGERQIQNACTAPRSRGQMKEALRHIVGVQFRNTATVGGSIAGRFGFSDVLTILLSMDCHVRLYRGGLVSLQDYAARTVPTAQNLRGSAAYRTHLVKVLTERAIDRLM